MATKKLTEKQLKSAYAELDALAGIQPPIVWLSQDQFERELHETVTDLVEPDDKFTDATQSVFDTLAEKFKDGGSENDEDDVEDVPTASPEEDEEEPEPEPEPVKPKVKAAKKKPAAKSPVKKDETVDDKPKVKAAPKKEEVKQPVSQEKDDQPESLTRADNFATIYAEGVPYTKKEWIKKMQDLYPKKVKNDVGARLHFNVYSKLLITLGKMKVTEDGKYVKA